MSLIINVMGYSLIQPPKQNNTYDDRVAVWPSRDPIEEDGGINLYAFVGNDPVGRWDKLGMDYMDPENTLEELEECIKRQEMCYGVSISYQGTGYLEFQCKGENRIRFIPVDGRSSRSKPMATELHRREMVRVIAAYAAKGCTKVGGKANVKQISSLIRYPCWFDHMA